MCQDENDIYSIISQNAELNNAAEMNEAKTKSRGLLSHILGDQICSPLKKSHLKLDGN